VKRKRSAQHLLPLLKDLALAPPRTEKGGEGKKKKKERRKKKAS